MTSAKEYLETLEVGEKKMKKKAMAAAQVMIDKFYESGFDPTIDYLKIFEEHLDANA